MTKRYREIDPGPEYEETSYYGTHLMFDHSCLRCGAKNWQIDLGEGFPTSECEQKHEAEKWAFDENSAPLDDALQEELTNDGHD